MTEIVLIVDDDPIQRRLLDAHVARMGLRPLHCDGGRAALDALGGRNGSQIAAVVLDLMMPDKSGMEVMAEFDTGWNGLRPYVSVANVTREFTYSNGFTTQDSGTPEWTGTLGVRSNWTAGTFTGTWDLFVNAESAVLQRDDSGTIVDEASGWSTVNLRGSMDLSDNVVLTFEAANLFDKSYRAIDQIEGAGRNVSLFLTATF